VKNADDQKRFKRVSAYGASKEFLALMVTDLKTQDRFSGIDFKRPLLPRSESGSIIAL
jgi:hypothetical protein